ncbi:MAG: 4Fe-4S dicluster domain-containing protein [Anaerolineales bacterium]|nr:4Fe-4S dicluster domain-containing protein [Anaerolineales bacterium]
MTETKLKRRGFLKVAGAGAAAVVGIQALQKTGSSEHGEEASPHSWAMVIDLEKCIGCGHCILACRAHNDINPEITWNPVYKSEGAEGQHVYISRPCMHCDDPLCVDVCPVKANYKRPDGIVAMDYDRCIGCRYCEVACPYYARSFNWEAFDGPTPAVPEWGYPEVPRRPRGVVEKCTLCQHRIDRGLANDLVPGVDDEATPACAVACPMGARIFGDLNDPDSAVRQALASQPAHRLREDLSTEPRVYYLCPPELEEVEL